MNLARITTKGQITIPIEIRRKLGVKDGDKVIFIEQDGKVLIENSAKVALRELQIAMRGEAEKAGLYTEEDVVKLCKEVRKELWEERNADND